MFDSEKVAHLNTLEMLVYQYVIEHPKEVSKLTIRQLSERSHVSTSTILRCCTKLGYEGFSEFKYGLKQELARHQAPAFEEFYRASIQINSFLKRVNQEGYQNTLQPAVDKIAAARHVVFSGIGTSGILGDYGSRYFSNLEMNAYSISDPFTPIPPRGLENTVAIILSVSGETVEMIQRTTDFKRYGAQVISITNNEESTIARMADYNLSYYMPEIKGINEKYLNLTTQVPVITLIELMAQQAYQLLQQRGTNRIPENKQF